MKETKEHKNNHRIKHHNSKQTNKKSNTTNKWMPEKLKSNAGNKQTEQTNSTDN